MQINERQKSWIKILISLGMIVAFGILVYVKQMGVYFETNDDRIIAEILSGAYSTAPDPHVIHENYLLTLPLSLLYRITVNIPWYGLCLLLFHVLAWFVIENSFLSRCEKWREYCLVLAGLSGLFLGSVSDWKNTVYLYGGNVGNSGICRSYYGKEHKKRFYYVLFVRIVFLFCAL